MILDDYDIVSLESNICAAEYAMESAKYEIDNGNREFAVVYEAASASVNNSANSWIDKVKSKISAILEKIRIALTKFSMRARLKKNTRQIKAFKKKSIPILMIIAIYVRLTKHITVCIFG